MKSTSPNIYRTCDKNNPQSIVAARQSACLCALDYSAFQRWKQVLPSCHVMMMRSVVISEENAMRKRMFCELYSTTSFLMESMIVRRSETPSRRLALSCTRPSRIKRAGSKKTKRKTTKKLEGSKRRRKKKKGRRKRKKKNRFSLFLSLSPLALLYAVRSVHYIQHSLLANCW